MSFIKPRGGLNFPIGWSKNQHETGCGVFSDPKCQWVLYMITKIYDVPMKFASKLIHGGGSALLP